MSSLRIMMRKILFRLNRLYLDLKVRLKKAKAIKSTSDQIIQS